MRTRLRRRSEKGAIAVEAVLIFPILVVLTFAVIDWALYLRDVSGATNLAREASRTASTLPRVGSGTNFGHDGQGTPSFAWEASQDVAGAALLVPDDTIVEMAVYLAGDDGFPIGSGGTLTCPASSCARYGWVPPATPSDTGEFTYLGGSTWDPQSITACAGNADSVGVYVKINHTSAGIAPSQVIAERAVTRFEPLPERPDQGIECQPSSP